MGVTVELIADVETWQRHAARWNELSRNVPFRSFAWLSTWWKYYGADVGQDRSRLFVLAVLGDDGIPLGYVPWHITRSLSMGRVASLLGTGEVYSDYLSILCERGAEEAIAEALANWLCGPAAMSWDIIELTGVDEADQVTNLLVDALARRSLTTQRRQGLSTWRIALPMDWESYLGQLSKSHRKQIRRLERSASEAGDVVAHVANDPDALREAYRIFVDLHQRRWMSQGKPGCFASQRFAGFLTSVTPQMYTAGQLRIVWLEAAGRPISADLLLLGDGVLYSYQSGIDPEALDLQPGRLAFIASVRQAIGEGFHTYDFLRGNEPYKAHYGAVSRPTAVIRIVSQRATAQLRNQAWVVGQEAKQWLKRHLLGSHAMAGASGA